MWRILVVVTPLIWSGHAFSPQLSYRTGAVSGSQESMRRIAHAMMYANGKKDPSIAAYAVTKGGRMSPNEDESSLRRSLLKVALAAAVPSIPLVSQAATAMKTSITPKQSSFAGTYTDPKHPGGTRTITVLKAKDDGGRVIKIEGGGGVGEPKSYTLPGVILPGDTTVIIDFEPKGGPKDFEGTFTKRDDGVEGIRFLRDGNFWPKVPADFKKTDVTPAKDAAAKTSSITPNQSRFAGTYTDPNHPGGTRKITVLKAKDDGGRVIRIEGGGGVGEPKSYTLPGVILPDDTTAIIDFEPKGGPKDFEGTFTKRDDGVEGIRFLRDGNFWPKVK